MAAPAIANAKPASTWFFDEHIEDVKEEAQMRTNGKLDINAAFVVSDNLWPLIAYHRVGANDNRNCYEQGEYKELRGMFPTAAGKIASNGPYRQVSVTAQIVPRAPQP